MWKPQDKHMWNLQWKYGKGEENACFPVSELINFHNKVNTNVDTVDNA